MDREEQRAAARATLARAPVKVSLWGGDAYVKRVSWAVAGRLRRAYPDDDAERMQARLMTAALCDEAGVATFDPHDDSDVDAVEAQGMEFMMTVANETSRVDPGKDSAQTTSS